MTPACGSGRVGAGRGDASFEELRAAAGPSDILARLTAQKLPEHLGEQFYVRLRVRNRELRGELQNMYVSGYTPNSRASTRLPEPLDSESLTIPSTAFFRMTSTATLPFESTRDLWD